MNGEDLNKEIRFLVESYYDVQKLRIVAYNNIVAYVGQHQKEGDKTKPSTVANHIIKGKIKVPKAIENLVWYHNDLKETEDGAGKRLDRWSQQHKIREYLNDVKGIGPILSSGLIAFLDPINRFDTISKLWAYAGLSAVHYECICEGKGDKKHKFKATHAYARCPVKMGTKRVPCNKPVLATLVNKPMKRQRGFLIMINTNLRTLMWKIGTSFEKQKAENSIYREIYENKKAYYKARPDLSKKISDKEKGINGHIRNMTLRYTEKQFLSDLWVQWRKIEELPITEPYVFAILKHTGKRKTPLT